MASSRDYSRYQTPSSQSRQLRSNFRSSQLTHGASQASTECNDAAVNTPLEKERIATIRTRLKIGPVDTKPTQWRRGMIVQFPHILPALDPNEQDPNLRVHTEYIGNVCPKVRKGIVVQVYAERMIVLQMYSAHQNGLARDYRLLAMSVVDGGPMNFTDDLTEEVLVVRGSYVNSRGKRTYWKPSPGSHVNLNEPLTCSYAWPLGDVDTLDQKSTDLLYRRCRIAQFMEYVPLESQEDYFRRERYQDQAKVKLQTDPPKSKPTIDEAGFQTVESKRGQSRR